MGRIDWGQPTRSLQRLQGLRFRADMTPEHWLSGMEATELSAMGGYDDGTAMDPSSWVQVDD